MKTTLDATPSGGRFDASRARERNEERETPDPMWALVVTHALVERLPMLPRSAAAEASEAPPDVEQTGGVTPSGAPAPDDALGADERASGNARVGGRGPATNVPSELCAEVSDERLGRLALRVVRGQGGLDIVIGVADSHVKALIMADQSTLMKTLKDAGLAVASLQIGSSTPIGAAARAGTHLAVKGLGAERQGAESPGPDRPRAASFRQPGARWRGYQGSPDKDDDDDGGVDFTA
jgi:hypothetical protein